MKPWILRTAGLVLFAPALALADEVYLQGAGVFSGRIVEQTDEMVTVDIGDGIIGLPMSRVERIETGRSALDEYDERARRLGPRDVSGWRGLGRWASQKGLGKQSRQAYEKALALDPDDAEAREALGFVRHEGRWLTEDESYRAQGYVEYEGEWMTSAEAQLAQASAAADSARRDAETRAIDAEIQAQAAEARAQEAEQRAAEEAEKARRYSEPVYWGGQGYGVASWPASGWTSYRPVSRAQIKLGK